MALCNFDFPWEETVVNNKTSSVALDGAQTTTQARDYFGNCLSYFFLYA